MTTGAKIGDTSVIITSMNGTTATFLVTDLTAPALVLGLLASRSSRVACPSRSCPALKPRSQVTASSLR